MKPADSGEGGRAKSREGSALADIARSNFPEFSQSVRMEKDKKDRYRDAHSRSIRHDHSNRYDIKHSIKFCYHLAILLCEERPCFDGILLEKHPFPEKEMADDRGLCWEKSPTLSELSLPYSNSRFSIPSIVCFAIRSRTQIPKKAKNMQIKH
jgi:hypothetical protein